MHGIPSGYKNQVRDLVGSLLILAQQFSHSCMVLFSYTFTMSNELFDNSTTTTTVPMNYSPEEKIKYVLVLEL